LRNLSAIKQLFINKTHKSGGNIEYKEIDKMAHHPLDVDCGGNVYQWLWQ
jgi:hypothetical protein